MSAAGVLMGAKVLTMLAKLPEAERGEAVAIIVSAYRPARSELSEKRAAAGRAGAAKRWQPDAFASGKPMAMPEATAVANGAVATVLPSPSLHSPSLFSSGSLSHSQQIGEGNVTEAPVPAEDVNAEWGLCPPAGKSTKRVNPAGLVDAFIDGVGGVWTCPRGQFADLAAALQPYAAKAPAGGIQETVRELGRRWRGYCAGAPDDAWKAVAWLGKDAPAAPTGGPRRAEPMRQPVAPQRAWGPAK